MAFTQPSPYEPPAIELEIYAQVTRGDIPVAHIAKHFEVSRQHVYNVVKRVNAWLAPKFMDEIREMKAEHTSRLLAIYSKAMRSWRKSLKDAESETTTTGGKDGGSTSTTVKGQTGNVAYLAQAQSALADIRKIWGADAPLKVEHSGEIRVAGQSFEEARNRMAEEMRKRLEVMNGN